MEEIKDFIFKKVGIFRSVSLVALIVAIIGFFLPYEQSTSVNTLFSKFKLAIDAMSRSDTFGVKATDMPDIVFFFVVFIVMVVSILLILLFTLINKNVPVIIFDAVLLISSLMMNAQTNFSSKGIAYYLYYLVFIVVLVCTIATIVQSKKQNNIEETEGEDAI